jgi:hypothetical protein
MSVFEARHLQGQLDTLRDQVRDLAIYVHRETVHDQTRQALGELIDVLEWPTVGDDPFGPEIA